jgi:hypothetical protein
MGDITSGEEGLDEVVSVSGGHQGGCRFSAAG